MNLIKLLLNYARMVRPSISRLRASLRMTGEERKSPVMLSLSKHHHERFLLSVPVRPELVEGYEWVS